MLFYDWACAGQALEEILRLKSWHQELMEEKEILAMKLKIRRSRDRESAHLLDNAPDPLRIIEAEKLRHRNPGNAAAEFNGNQNQRRFTGARQRDQLGQDLAESGAAAFCGFGHRLPGGPAPLNRGGRKRRIWMRPAGRTIKKGGQTASF